MTLQQDLFGCVPGPDPEQEPLEATLGDIRDRFGWGTMQRGLNPRLANPKGAAGSEGG